MRIEVGSLKGRELMFKFGDHYWIPGRPEIKVSQRDDPRYKKKDIKMNDTKNDEVVETHVVDKPSENKEANPSFDELLKRAQEKKPV